MQLYCCSKCVGVPIFLFFWRLCIIIAQPGFLSIDCGGISNLTDPATGITWVTDDNYIDNSSTTRLPVYSSTLPFYMQNVRVFPNPLNKSCYELPVIPNVPHLLRIWFDPGTAYALQQIPHLDFSVEAVDMVFSIQVAVNKSMDERTLITSGKVVYLCLIRYSKDYDPYISAIELVTLEQGMYDDVNVGQILQLIARYDVGTTLDLRYPQDRFDRLWKPLLLEGYDNGNTWRSLLTNDTRNRIPPAIMRSVTFGHNDSNMQISLPPFPALPMTKSFLLMLYFADLQPISSESRTFHILINNQMKLPNVSLPIDYATVEIALRSETPQQSFSLQKACSRPPIINGYEQFRIVFTEPATSSVDSQVLTALKEEFNMKNWISDPCFLLPWEGIQCIKISSTVRVSEINMSGRNLTGSLPENLAQLTELVYMSFDNNKLTGALPNLSGLAKLERLHLQNNNLRGRVPDWLSQLHNLKELDIRNNNFSGGIPQQLLNRRSLKINYSGNYYLCMNKGECLFPPISKKNNMNKLKYLPRRSTLNVNRMWLITGIIVIGSILTGLAFSIGRMACPKKKLKRDPTKKIQDYSPVFVPNTSKSHAFSLEEMIIATDNFSHTIGQGGFGSVFAGKLRDEKQIAVKVLSLFSKQGVAEFLNEINLLSRVHHKKLVSLLGYCNESRDLMLVYEYMPGGSLSHHLHGNNTKKYPELVWKTRLKITLDAAQGLEYLHIGCTPKIIHRDVKTANILVDNNLNGKLADFGLSRIARDEDASHVFTGVRGTAGYLDPKYYSTHKLTEKSDVYSFGVVLLEIICGRRPVDLRLSEEKIDLAKWVTPYLAKVEDANEILEIIDKRLLNNCDMNSVTKVAKLAISCIADEPFCRPAMNEVVMEMKEALKFENENCIPATADGVSAEIGIEHGDLRSIDMKPGDLTCIDIEPGDLKSIMQSFTPDSNEGTSKSSSIKSYFSYRDMEGRD